MMVSFVLSFFPRDVLDEILNLIESVSEDFPSYSFILIVLLLSFVSCLRMTILLVKIDAAVLSVRNVQLLPAIAIDLNQTIAHHNAKFPIQRVEVKTFTVGTGLRSKVEDHLFQGQLPKRLFIGMVDHTTFNGSFATNPFNFQHFNLSKLEVSCGGHSIYGKPFEPKFDMDQYLRSYMSLYQALSSQNQIQNCNINYDDYKGGYCFWGYDFTPDQGADQSHLHPIKTGNLRVELQFARALDKTINVIVYAEFDT